ncbi:MAG: ABC transporter ATP-binding protein [Thermoplasmatota archaeon]
MEPIRYEKVSLWYGEVVAVNDVTAAIQPGITGLLGPNGAGKSTLMRLTLGLQHPTLGSVTVLGESPQDNPRLLAKIGYVPEGPPPWQELSGRRALERAARLSGLSAPSGAVSEALRTVGLEGAADRAVAGYSLGMQQRLKFAMASVHHPELLILDEPLAGTDPLARRDLIGSMREWAASGAAILLSTHVLPDVAALTERILLLNHGRLMAHGEVAEIRSLMEGVARTVRVATPAARELGATLWQWPTVLSIESDADALTIRTRDPAGFYQALQEHLTTSPVAVTSITSPDDTVEALFHALAA